MILKSACSRLPIGQHNLFGFGYTISQLQQKGQQATLSEESKESLQDLADIAQLDAQEALDSDEAEEDVFAVADHLRLIAINLFLDFNEPVKQQKQQKVTAEADFQQQTSQLFSSTSRKPH